MKRSRFTETQIVAILAEADAGMAVTEVCCRHGICGNTFYNWKKKYGGDLSLESDALKELISKKL